MRRLQHRSRPLSVRILQTAAAAAGTARLAVRQRTLKPALPPRRHGKLARLAGRF
jgi:hypothetical protein